MPGNWRIETDGAVAHGSVGRAVSIMSRRFRVQLDRQRLLNNLAREDGRLWTDAELDQWLLDAGFQRSGDRWLVAEEDLSHLDPAEVVSAEPID